MEWQGLTVYDGVGFVGVFLYVLAYALLAFRKIDGNGQVYILINMVAAMLVLVSLCFAFNAPSFVTQSIWIVLSLFALNKIRKQNKEATL